MKYTIKFSCGHEATIGLSGKLKERERKIEYYEQYGICPSCYAANVESKKAEGCEQVVMTYHDYKTNWPWLKTASNSYNKREKTISVYFPLEYKGLEEYISLLASNRLDDDFFNKSHMIINDALDDGKITMEQAKVLASACRAMRW